MTGDREGPDGRSGAVIGSSQPDHDPVPDHGEVEDPLTGDDLQNLRRMDRPLGEEHQGLVVGGPAATGPVVWHPFACPYPFRGGNNVVVRVRRTVSYPLVTNAQEQDVEGIFPVLKGLLVGYTYVTADIEEGQPPSSDFAR